MSLENILVVDLGADYLDVLSLCKCVDCALISVCVFTYVIL